MKKILFLCTGNTCRSPMAAALFNKRAAELGLLDMAAISRGLMAESGEPPAKNAVQAVADLGCDISEHSAEIVTQADVEGCDMVFTMSYSQADALKRAFPDFADKITTIADSPILDPYGGNMKEYRECRDRLFAAVERILKREMKKK